MQWALVWGDRAGSEFSPRDWRNCKVNAPAASGEIGSGLAHRNRKLTGRSECFPPSSCLPVSLELPLLAEMKMEPAG